jgi:hypothetical protein
VLINLSCELADPAAISTSARFNCGRSAGRAESLSSTSVAMATSPFWVARSLGERGPPAGDPLQWQLLHAVHRFCRKTTPTAMLQFRTLEALPKPS